MEYEVEVIIKRYGTELTSPFLPPEEVEVFRQTRTLVDNPAALYDILDDAKKGQEAIEKDIKLNCIHDDLAFDDTLDVCPVCGVTRQKIYQYQAEDEADVRAKE